MYLGIFLFHGNMLAPYRKIEMLELLMFSFRIVQNFRANSQPLNSSLEKNALHIWIQNDLSFSKLFEIWKSDKKWQLNNPNIHAHTRAHPLTPAYIRAQPHTPAYSCTYPHTPHYWSLFYRISIYRQYRWILSYLL